MRQLIGSDGQDSLRGRDPVQAQRHADLFLERGCDPPHRRAGGDASQTIGIEAPEHQVGIGDGDGSAASPIGDRPGAGAGAFGPDLQEAGPCDPRDAAAPAPIV